MAHVKELERPENVLIMTELVETHPRSVLRHDRPIFGHHVIDSIHVYLLRKLSDVDSPSGASRGHNSKI